RMPAVARGIQVRWESIALHQPVQRLHLSIRQARCHLHVGVQRESCSLREELLPAPDEAERDLARPVEEPGAVAQADQLAAPLPTEGGKSGVVPDREKRDGCL